MADEKPMLREVGDLDTEMDRREQENAGYLSEFELWLRAQGLSAKTVDKHYSNIDYFLDGFLLEEEPLTMEEGLDCVDEFLGAHLIQQGDWSSIRPIKENITSLKKFYQCMMEKGYVSAEAYSRLLDLIRDNKDSWYYTNEAYLDKREAELASSSLSSTCIDDLLRDPQVSNMMSALSSVLLDSLADSILDEISAYDLDEDEEEDGDEDMQEGDLIRGTVFYDLLVTAFYLMSFKMDNGRGEKVRVVRKDIISDVEFMLMQACDLLGYDAPNREYLHITDFGVDVAKDVLLSLGHPELARERD